MKTQALFYENTDPRKVVSVVPTSALSGEGVADLLRLSVDLTQKMLEKRLMLSPALEATVRLSEENASNYGCMYVCVPPIMDVCMYVRQTAHA